MKKKFLVAFLILSLVLQLFSIQLLATQADVISDTTSSDITSERKLYFNVNDDSEFADDTVLVVFKNSESLKFNSYSKNDFENVKVKQIDDLSSASKELVKTKVELMLSQSDRNHSAKSLDAENITSLSVNKYNQILRIKLEDTGREKVISAIKELEKREDVLLACPDYYIVYENTNEVVMTDCEVTTLEMQTRTDSEAITNDPYIELQWALEQIDVFSAWENANPNEKVLVGVLDSGIDADHPDLDDNVNEELSMDFTYETPNNQTALIDTFTHGTQVAGIIAAEINNTEGISGVSPNVELVSLKINHGAGEVTSASGFISALNYASDNDIKIINASVAWYEDDGDDNRRPTELSESYKTLFEQAIENYDGLLICGAANRWSDIDDDDNGVESYPSEFDCENILSVGASDRNDNRYNSSCWGAQSVDLFAPGVAILSCLPSDNCAGHNQAYNPNDSEDEWTHVDEGYHFFKNTSSATPFVTGVASMLLANYPYMTADDLKQTIMMNVDVIASDPDEGIEGLEGLCVTGGRLNAYKAMTNPIHVQHYAECLCVDSQTHKYVCRECGDVIVEAETHIYEAYISYTSTTHISICENCSYIKQSFHRWITDPITGETKCKFCGAT